MHAELIAPRPLRLTAPLAHSYSASASSLIRPNPKPVVRLVSAPPTEAFAHVSLADGDEDDLPDRDRPPTATADEHDLLVATRRDAASPRFSPDALEEFLSILQPVVFNTPASPIVRARYERPHPYKSRGAASSHKRARSNSANSDDAPRTPDHAIGRGASKPLDADDHDDELADEFLFDPRPWQYSSFLASPISRMHTQNPLGRHVSHDTDVPIPGSSISGGGGTVGGYLFRSTLSPTPASASSSTPNTLDLAQSVPIPPSPPTTTDSHTMDL